MSLHGAGLLEDENKCFSTTEKLFEETQDSAGLMLEVLLNLSQPVRVSSAIATSNESTEWFSTGFKPQSVNLAALVLQHTLGTENGPQITSWIIMTI
jgi:hypothetical protein